MCIEAESKGFKTVFVMFRGCGGMPAKGEKLYNLKAWESLVEPIDYLHETYALPQKRRMYLYGMSLGGTMVAHYLINKDKTHPFSGAATYGQPFDPFSNEKILRERLYGLYDVGLGFAMKAKF